MGALERGEPARLDRLCTFVPMSDYSRSQRERMLAGDWCTSDDELQAMTQCAHQLAEQYAQTWKTDPTAAREVLDDLLGSVGEHTVIRPPLYVDYGVHNHVGARTFVNFGLVASMSARSGSATTCRSARMSSC